MWWNAWIVVSLIIACIQAQIVPPTPPTSGPSTPTAFYNISILQTNAFSTSSSLPAGSILSISHAGGPSACTNTIIFLTDSSTDCLVFTTVEGTVLSTSCDPLLVGSTSMVCDKLYCYVANPSTGDVVVINAVDGTVVSNLAEGSIFPKRIAVYEDVQQVWTYIFVTDAASDALWVLKVDCLNPYSIAESVNLFNSTATTEVAGLFYEVSSSFDDRGNVYLTYVGDERVFVYYYVAGYLSSSATTFNLLGNFTNDYTSIQVTHNDFYERLFVVDAGCQCTQLFDANRQMLGSLAELPSHLITTRNSIIMLVGGEVKTFIEPLESTVVLTNKQCDSRLAIFDVVHTGGALPITYLLIPEATYLLGTEVYDINITEHWFDIDVLPPIYHMPVYVEDFSAVFNTFPEQASVDSSVIAPHGGNLSFSMLIDNVEGFGLFCEACISPRFTSMDFYLNVGDGNQSFSIQFGYFDKDNNPAIVKTYTILAGDYAPYNWTKVSLPMGFDVAVSNMYFTNIGPDNITSPIYVDDWYFEVSEYSPVRKVKLLDYCGASAYSPDIVISNDNALSVKLRTTEAACSAALRGTNSILSSNGEVTAEVINGEAPYTYSWNFPNATSNDTITGLSEFNTYVNIYDNALKSGWYDTSILPDRNYASTAQYHSPPYSISLLQPADGDDLYLKMTSPSIITGTADSVLTFWINGGDIGAQSMNLYLKLFNTDMDSQFVADLIPGVKSILPNVWMQAIYRFRYTFKFNSITLKQGCPKSGYGCPNTAYVDDFVLSIAPALVVTDATGCSSKVMDLTITAPPILQVNTNANNAKCYNSSSGFVDLDVVGGVAPYIVEYSAGNIPKTRASLIISEIASLAESKVSINVTDANGCIATRVVETILQPPPLSLKLSMEPVKCYGGSTTLSSTMAGGMAPYTYTWSSAAPITQIPQPAPRPVFTDSLSLMYSLSSNVKTECLGTGSQISLPYPPTHAGYCSLFPTFSQATPSMTITCPTIATSQFAGVGMWIFVEKSADVNKLSISLAKDGAAVSVPVSLASIAKITAGSWNKIYYNISNTTLTNQKPTQIVITSSDPTSMGVVILDDIVLMPVVATSVGIVVYPGFNSIVSGTAGQYFLTVVDGNGCSFLKQVIIEQPEKISINVSITGATSANATDGSIIALAAGGTPPYTYFWRTLNATGQEVHAVAYGGYEVQITDANGCIYSETFVVPVDEVKAVRGYAKGLSIGLGVFVGIAVIVSIFSLAMLAIFWSSYQKYGIFYCLTINVGVLLSYVAILTLLPRPTDALCIAFPWLLGIAFCLVYSSLFVKIWSVYKTWRKSLDSDGSGVKPTQILKILVLALIIEIVVLAAWTASDPPKVKRVDVVNNELQDQCRTDHPTFWIIFITLKGSWLLVGTVLSFFARAAMAERGSSDVAYATYNFLLLLLIGIPLGVLLGKVPSARMVIELILPVIAFTSTLFIMFFKTWHATFFHDEIKFPPNSQTNSGSNSAGNSRTTVSTFSASHSHSQSQSAAAY